MKIQLILALMLFTITACKTTKENQTTINPETKDVEVDSKFLKTDQTEIVADLTGCWLDSREENVPESGIRVFRPCDFEGMPPSRFRYKFILNEDGTSSWLTLSPNDAHYMSEGKWSIEEGNIVYLKDEEGNTKDQFTVSSISEDKLEILTE